jgi:hypothetical protein
VIAATNHAQRLDPAALRRFVFKIDLAPLGPVRAALAFERFFGMSPPSGMDSLGHLTPGISRRSGGNCAIALRKTRRI